MTVLFAASPTIAVPCLLALERGAPDTAEPPPGIALAGVLTNPDTPKGRARIPTPTDIGAAAEALSRRRVEAGHSPLPIIKAGRIDDAVYRAVEALKPDLLVSFAYGALFPPAFLSLFPLGGVNVHPSLLPRHRGATPIQAAILAGDAVTGISVQSLAERLDTGAIYATLRLPLVGDETTASLSRVVAERAPALLLDALADIAAGRAKTTEQNNAEATLCHALKKTDGVIDWNESASTIDRKVRAFTPWPLCSTTAEGRELFILAGSPLSVLRGGTPGTVLGVDARHGILIQTGDGVYAARVLQYKTKKPLEWRAFMNGARGFVGTTLI